MTLSVEKLKRHLREAEASKMLAKGFKFKVLLKDKPPLYAKDMAGAKKLKKKYPSSQIVKNEHVELEEAGGRDLSQMLPWANDEDLVAY